MTQDSLEKQNKELLFQYLKQTKALVDLTMKKYSLQLNDHIEKLVGGIWRMINDLEIEKMNASRVLDTFTYFISDITKENYNHLVITIIPYVMRQDHLDYQNNISALIVSVDERLEQFDEYWAKMEKGIIKRYPNDKS